MDAEGKAPYLSRYYLLGAPRMADGSHPFDDRGNPREGVIWDSDLGVYLHCFHQSDGRHCHSHPFAWSTSIILVGGYREFRVSKIGGIVRQFEHVYLPGDTNTILVTDFHRVELIDGECWTLFTVGKKHSSWGFLDEGGEYVPWREFLYNRRST
jgi:hypothetical protein